MKLNLTYGEKIYALKERFKSLKKGGDHETRIEGAIDPAVIKGIMKALTMRYMMKIFYKGDKENRPGWRLIQPYCYGLNHYTGNHVLRAYQIDGPSVSGHEPYWRLFRLDRIGNLAITTKQFNTPVYLFNPTGDNGMAYVIKIIKFPKK